MNSSSAFTPYNIILSLSKLTLNSVCRFPLTCLSCHIRRVSKRCSVIVNLFLSLSQEKQILQKAHGQQELAVSSTNGINQEAKRCVDMWLKMPGTFLSWIRKLLHNYWHCHSDDELIYVYRTTLKALSLMCCFIFLPVCNFVLLQLSTSHGRFNCLFKEQ